MENLPWGGLGLRGCGPVPQPLSHSPPRWETLGLSLATQNSHSPCLTQYKLWQRGLSPSRLPGKEGEEEGA